MKNQEDQAIFRPSNGKSQLSLFFTSKPETLNLGLFTSGEITSALALTKATDRGILGMHGLLDLIIHDPHKLPGPIREEGETMRGICGFFGLGGGESLKISRPTASSSCQNEI